MSKPGVLTVIAAPTMFAGKSDSGDFICRRAEYKKIPVAKLTHSADVRGGGVATSIRHSGLVTSGVTRVSELGAFANDVVSGAQLIWIDEAQFFPDLCEAVSRWLASGKDVVVSGLYLDYNGRPWGKIMECAAQHPLKEFILLHADCTRCHSERSAMYCPRKVQGSDTVLVGGANEYDALCKDCYFNRE